MEESKFVLRKFDFPICAQECLKQLEKALQSPKLTGTAYTRSLREIHQCVDEFIFCFIDKRGTFDLRLGPIQQLQVYHLLCEYFDAAALMDPRARYNLFDILFLGQDSHQPLHEARLNTLTSTISVAVALNCFPILSDCAQWIQKQGFWNESVKKVVSSVLLHYCSPDPSGYKQLFDLVGSDSEKENEMQHAVGAIEGSPAFALCLLIFALGSPDESLCPEPFYAVLSEWFAKSPKILLRHLKSASKNTLKYSTLAISKLLVNTLTGPLMNKGLSQHLHDVWQRLHVAELNFLLLMSQQKLELQLLSAKQVADLLQVVKDASDLPLMDRLGQTFQACIAAKCFQGNKEEIEKMYRATYIHPHPLFEYIFTGK